MALSSQTPQAKATGNNSRSHMPQPSVFQGVRACRLLALKRFKPSAGLSKATGNNSRSHMPQPSVLKPAICFSGRSSLPFACPQTLQTLLQAFPRQLATTLAATCPSHLFLTAFDPCRLPDLKPFKHFNPFATGKNSRSHAPAICF